MKKQRNGISMLAATALFAVLLAAPAQSASEEGWGKFFEDKVSFGGFVENTTGLSIASGSRFTNTSNRFYMNRFTFQPELNVQAADWAKFFISWRFVGEPRYSAETKSRFAAVNPPGTGGPLPVDFYSEYSGVPWEAVADILPTDRLQLRIGRQFISWGETDGQRLIDLINPQNVTFAPPAAPNLFNLDETRVPQWGFRMLYTVRPVSNTIFEFFANPGFDPKKLRVDEFSPTNDIGDGKADGDMRYGRWSGRPETRMPVARLLANPLGAGPVIPAFRRDHPDAGDSWKIGGRLTHNFGALAVGLGYINGYNPQGSDMVFKMKGAPIPCGPPACPPGGTLVRADLVNDRTHIFAAHLNYPIDEPLGIPIKSALRGEFAFYPNKPYNIGNFPGINCATGVPTGLRAGPSCKHPSNIVEKDTIRYALGFDRSAFIPFLQDDPWRAFRMTFQIFQSIILDHEKGIRTFGYASQINKVTTLLTFRVNTGYLGDTILPDVSFAYDPEGYYAINPAVTYQPPWNEKLQFTLTAVILGGHNKFKSLGLFSEKDSVFFRMRYQF